MLITAVSAPWTETLTQPQYMLVLYFLVITGLALFAGVIRTLTTQGEVGSRYRSAVVARLCVSAVAVVSYILLIVAFDRGYDSGAGGYTPNAEAINTFALRYMDWSVTVPVLTVELLAVCTLSGAMARRTRMYAMAGAFGMIFTGFLGSIVIGGGEDTFQLLLWGGISGIFWVFTNVVLIRAVRQSLSSLTPEAAMLLRNATILLLSGWVIYPAVYVLNLLGTGGGWTTTMQIVLCCADMVVKLGFGGLVHRIAKLRTAEDVRAGADVHPESIWISSVKQSDAGIPREVYLADGADVHTRRAKPPMSAAVAAPPSVMDDLNV